MPRKKPKPQSEDLAAVNLSIAKARLTKLEADLPSPPTPTPEYTHYEDLPPLRPEEAEELKQELIELLTVDA